MDRFYRKNLQIAQANDVSLEEVLIMNTLCQSKLIVDDVYFCEDDKAWYTDIPQDGQIYLGKNIDDAFDFSYTLSLQSTRCLECNQFTLFVDDDDEPFCGKCGEIEDKALEEELMQQFI